MAASPLSQGDAIVLLMEQVKSRNEEIALRRTAMSKAVRMLKEDDYSRDEIITTLIEGM